jgi:hypothetical protein
MIRKILLASFALLSLLGIFTVQVALAADQDPLFHGDGNSNLCSGDANSSAVCQDKTSTNPLTGNDGLFIKITNIIAWVAGAAAVIVILVSAIRYATAGGDSNKVGSAKGALINAAIGLIVVVLARTLIIYVLNKL